MATTAKTINLTGCNLQLRYDVLSQSVANNSSKVRLYVVLNVTNNYVNWSSGTAWVHTSGSVGISTYYAKGSHTLLTRDYTFTHSSDGTLSIAPGFGISTTFISGSSTGTINLPKIARYATITNSIGDFNDEANPWFDFNNPADSTMSCWLEVNPNGEHLCTRTVTGKSGRYTWTLTEAERNQLRAKLPNANSGKIRIGLYSTISGSTNASYVDKNFTIVNANPTFTNFEFAETQTTSLTGSATRFIKGYSDVRITISNANKATAKKGATLVNYQTSIGTKLQKSSNLNYPVTYTLYDVDNAKIETSIVDSRGNSTKVTKNATLVNYTPLSYSNLKITRQNNVGTDVVLEFSGKLDKVNFGAVTNSLKSIKYYYKRYGAADSTYVQGATTLNPTIDNNGNITINQAIQGDISGGGFNQNESYTIKLELKDEINTLYSTSFSPTATLSSGSPAIAVKGNSVALGRNYDENAGGRVQIPTDIKTYINSAWRGLFSGNYFNNDLMYSTGTTSGWNWIKLGKIGICWKYLSTTLPSSGGFSAWGGVYSRDNVFAQQTYPFTFASNPAVSIVPVRGGDTSGNPNFWIFTGNQPSNPNTTTPAFGIARGTNWTIASTVKAVVYAIGITT